MSQGLLGSHEHRSPRVLGDITEALVLLGFVFVMIGIELSQERPSLP
ncbi:MAG: hypothetical protein WCI05_14120 [Myxococcales bacterium]|jgi:hypothetical protein